jgi:hypothetical protein
MPLNAREGGRHVQRVVKALGRRDEVEASGMLDALVASAARHSRRSIVLSSFYRGEIAYAKAHRPPELTEQTIWEVFEAERPKLVPYAGRFDGFHTTSASVSKTCLVRLDNNKYSVAASAVGRPCLCASTLSSARTAGLSPTIRARSAVVRRSTTPGITRSNPIFAAPWRPATPGL